MTSINELEDDLYQLNIDEGTNTVTQRQRQARARQTVEEYRQNNENLRVRIREHRAGMTEEEHRQYNANNAAQHRERRAGMTEEEHRQYNANNAAQHREHQAGMTEEEHRQNNENRRLRDTERRAGMTEEEHHHYNVNRRLRDTEHRTQMTEEERQQYNERRRRRRYQYASYRACNCNIDTFNPNTSYIIPNDLGPMTHQCGYCGALGFKCEMKRNEGITHMGKMCCNQGQIDLPPPPPAPIKLYALFTEGTPEAKMFRHLIRYFNSGMAMGSLQADDATLYQGGPAAFKLHGQLYKRIGPMLPAHPSVHGDGTPKCLQIYFCDAEEQANIRVRQDCGVRRNRTTYEKHKAMFKLLHNILTTCGNPHLRKYLSIHEEITRTGMNPDDIQIVIETHPDDARHSGRFGAPVSTEIFALLPDRTNEHVSKYAIITPMRQSDPTNNPIRRIPDHYKIHDPLLYPLLRPTGEEGWHRELHFRSRKISAREYTRFRMMKRILSNVDPLDPNETVQMHDISHLACKLWQQWLCDAWAKVESNDLGWVQNHQDEIYADKYVNVKKRAAQNTTGGGKPSVLPATYTGSDRYMYKKFQDAMALCRVFGRPHLFITFTMDVFCKEVTDQLMPGQNPYDRPDIIARVYWQKYKAFISEIAKDGIFGKCIARCSTVEFQKRGAPHTHTLLWIENFNNSTANLDDIISAEIPLRGEEGTLQRELYDLVTSKMIHGPCSHGWSCWKNDCCSKYFPYAFTDETIK